MPKYLLLSAMIGLSLGVSGCSSEENSTPAVSTVTISTHQVHAQTVNFIEDLPARVQPFRIAEIRPQVGGIIEKVLFTQGSEVRAGQPLFKINADMFQADLRSNQAALSKAEAEVARLKTQVARFEQLLPSNAISKQEMSDAQAQYRQAIADVAQMKAGLSRQHLTVQYATVRAPISGQIGKILVTEGALVGQGDSNAMAVIQQIDKVYVDVKQSINEYEKLQAALEQGNLASNQQQTVQILNNQGMAYPVTAKLLFSDINVDQETGDVTIRIEVENPQRKLLPGMFVRVQINRNSIPNALLVPEQAVQRDSSGKAQVYVLNAQGKAIVKPVETGPLYQKMVVIQHGLNAGDQVIVEGIERIATAQKFKTQVWKNPQTQSSNAPQKAASATANQVKQEAQS